MGSLRFGDLSDSPTMVMSPRRHSFDPMSSYHHSLQQYHSYNSFMPMNTAHNFASQSFPTAKWSIGTKPSTSSNKRKRNSSDDESETSSFILQQSAPLLPTEDELSFRQAMPLAKLNNDCPMTGSDPNATHPPVQPEDALKATIVEDLPTLPRQKCLRRESTTMKDSLTTHSPQAAIPEPIIDDYTHQLGVGWSHVSSDPSTQSASRGWAKYIENHYRLSDVAIILLSKALEGASLVCARNGAHKGYFLFSENLGEARLVANNWEICLGRLRGSPIVFENEEVLCAAKTPVVGAISMRGGCAMLPGLATLPADDLMVCD